MILQLLIYINPQQVVDKFGHNSLAGNSWAAGRRQGGGAAAIVVYYHPRPTGGGAAPFHLISAPTRPDPTRPSLASRSLN